MSPEDPRPRLSIVLAAYNERDVIGTVVSAIRTVAPSGAEIVVYDDGSSDGTSAALDELALKGCGGGQAPALRVIHGGVNRGFDAAVTAALHAASGDLIHYSDSDGQHDPADLGLLLLAQRRQGADLVVGWKRPRRDPMGRLLLSWGMNFLCRILFGSRLHDRNCGFRLMTRRLRDEVLPRVGSLPTFLSTEMTIRAQAMGFKVIEVPVTHRPRASGRSRSLPLQRLPRILARMLAGLLRLRRELHET